ncbi:hypothetical protein GGI08_007494, partial [Coemansia sp. S2]
NPSVVANAVAALTEISERSPHIKLKLNMKIANKLITALNECNEWGQIYILESLMYVVPQDSSNAETIMERIMPRLQHGNSGVVLVSIKVIAYMMNYVSQVETLEPILRKLSPPLVTLLTSGPEVQYITLRNIQLLLQRWPTILQNQLRAFFCKYDDPIYVKLAKLEVILSLTTEENARVVLTELTEYATEIDVDFVRKAVRSIGRIAIKIELAADRCVRALLDLIQTKVNYVVQEAIVVIRDIFRKYPNRYESIIGTLCENLDSLDEPEARAAMIWIIGQYADRIDNSDVVLGTFLESFLDDTAEVQLALLTAIVKLFIMRPTAGQDLVPKVLKWATEDVDSPDIRDRGFIYWRLLSTDPEMARTVVLSDKPEITAEGEKLDMPLLEELLLQVGTLSSIYRKPPSTFIPFAKKRALGVSPALTRLTIAPPPVSRLPRTISSAMSQPATAKQANAQASDIPPVSATPRSSNTQLTSSALDISSGAVGGMSNPYINDYTPGPMASNDAVLIDLMSMEDDEDAVDGGGAAINSAGMVGFNANFGLSGMNLASMDSTNNASAGATSQSSMPNSQQVLNSAFDAAGLDALSNMPTSAMSLNRPSGNQSPMPDLMRQFTSSFDLSSASSGTLSAGGNVGSLLANSGSQLDPFQQQQQAFQQRQLQSAAFSLSAPAGVSGGHFGSSSAFPTALSPTSTFFGANSASPFNNSAPFSPLAQSHNSNLAPNSAPPAIRHSESESAPPATSHTNTKTDNSAALSREVDELAAKMYNTGMLNSFSNNGGYTANVSGSVPYVPSQQVLLDATQTQGLEIL